MTPRCDLRQSAVPPSCERPATGCFQFTQADGSAPDEADGLESENDSDSNADMDEAAQVAKAKAVAASMKESVKAAGEGEFPS